MDRDLKNIIDQTLAEYFGSDPSSIGVESGEKKYCKQEPGGQMAAVNANEDLSPDAFTSGYCAEFALAVNEIYGFPIVSFDEHIVHGKNDIETQSIHYACKKGSLYVDVRGLRSEAEIRHNLLGSDMKPAKNVKIRKVSANSLEDETEINDSAVEEARQFIHKKLKTTLAEASFRVYNETLCPDLWDEQLRLNPAVRVNLLRMAYDFYKKTKLVAPIIDVYLMGSIANYNWTPDSDADVHVIIDFNQLQMPGETASKVAKSAGASWNNEHDVTVKGHKVEINIQSVKAEKPHVTGIYSLVKDEWIRQPQHMDVQIDKPLIQSKVSAMKRFIEFTIESGDREAMKNAKDYLDDFRQYGLDNAGELSTENIVYKVLRAKGLVKKLKDSITSVYDQAMTVTEVGDFPIRPDYIGGIVQGEVRAEPLRPGLAKSMMHGTFSGLSSGQNTTNWRYDSDKNVVTWNLPPESESVLLVNNFLEKRNIVNPRHKSMYSNMDEITQKDIQAKFPLPIAIYRGNVRLDLMTLGNLKHLRDKSFRMWKAYQNSEDLSLIKHLKDDFQMYGDEIKRRMAYINSPVNESESEFIVKKELQLKKYLPSLRPEDVQIVVNHLPQIPEASYIQVDGTLNGENTFSANPEILNKFGFKMPSTAELLKLPTGKYMLPDAIKQLNSLNEMATITRSGNTVMANTTPLRNMKLDDVRGNIVLIRADTDGIIAKGYTLAYFMDSDESAELMAKGKIAYLMVPRGTFHSGGNPITDIWKKRFQSPGTEHILGMLEGNTSDEMVYIDMLTVRPGYRRNQVASLLLKTLKSRFPNAKITTSASTDDGTKFKKASGLNEGHDPYYGAAIDFHERRDKQLCEIAEFLKENDKNKRIPWKTISARLLKKVWLQFGKWNRIDENGLDKIADQLLTNIARLQVANDFQGHTQNYYVREEILDQCGIEFTDKEWNDNVWRFCDKDGTDYLSDYGMEPLTKLYSSIFAAPTPEEKLYACDKALNVVHQRSDLASMFVEGGTQTLVQVANQGGYDGNYEPGEIHRQTLDMKESSEEPEFETFVLFDCYISGQPGKNWFTIYEFGSENKNQGNAEKALIELKNRYKNIAVIDIGYPGDNSYTFWKHMLKKKIVDEVHDANGKRHKQAMTMKEGYGAGIPSQDRLHIPNHRWQIRSKDAPKTPKMKEDVDPRGDPLTTTPSQRRIDFTDNSKLDSEIGPEIKNIIHDAEKLLDKKFAQGIKFVTVEYVHELFDDLAAQYLSDLPSTSPAIAHLKKTVVDWLSLDYDIRHDGKRIREAMNESTVLTEGWKDLYIGYIDPSTFKIDAISAEKTGNSNLFNRHDYFNVVLGQNVDFKRVISWRYRKDQGYVYWWPIVENGDLPDQKYLDEVAHWIKKNIGGEVIGHRKIWADMRGMGYMMAHGDGLSEEEKKFVNDLAKQVVDGML